MTEVGIIAHWQVGARNELLSAKLLHEGGQYSAALFHCHLAVEKALKARYMSEQQREAPLTHDLVQLAMRLQRSWSDEDKQLLADLTQYAVAARYDDPQWAEREATAAKTASWIAQVNVLLSPLLP